MVATIGSFKAKNGTSYPTLTLKAREEDKYGFTFGKQKARLVLENLDEIRKFAESK